MKRPFLPHVMPAILALALLAGCTVKDPAGDDPLVLSVMELILPDSLYLDSPRPKRAAVRLSETDAGEFIQTVSLILENTTGQEVLKDTLLDNGVAPDLAAGDGVFSGWILPGFTQAPGLFLAHADIQADVETWPQETPDSLYVVAGDGNTPPELSAAQVPDTLNNETLSASHFEVSVEDLDGAGDIDTVTVALYPPQAASPVVSLQLYDEGRNGDATAGDGIYSLTADLEGRLFARGTYRARFSAQDRFGEESAALVRPFEVDVVIEGNTPPVLSELTLPDTLSRNKNAPTKITVRVTDAQGPGDVRWVLFNTTLPSGQPATNNPFEMYDDGTNGDAVAGDSVYSLEIVIESGSSLGDYIFEFSAMDYSDAESDTLTHVMTVVD